MTSTWYPPMAGELEGPRLDFAAALQRALGSAAGVAEAAAAAAQGERDPNRLTDVIFRARHRERGNRPIGPGETQLANEWRWIRGSVVTPALRLIATLPPVAAPPAPVPAAPPARFTLPPDPAQLRPPARTNIRAVPLLGSEVLDVEVQLIKDLASRPDGFVYLANWYARVHFYPWFSLPNVAFALQQCAQKGGTIRALFWDGSLTQEMKMLRGYLGVLGRFDFVIDPIRDAAMKNTNHKENSATQSYINTLPRAVARLDDSTQIFGSHHQKIFVVGNSEDTVAIVGGVDLHPNRIVANKDSNGKPENDGTPLFDISVQLDGDAAADIADLFERRWKAAPDSPMYLLPQRKPSRKPRPPKGATVQLGPNFGCGRPLRNIPTAVRSGGALIRNTLRNCRSFFYAEDQYGVGNAELADGITQAFRNGAQYGVVVLAGTLVSHDLPDTAYHRHRFWSRFPQIGTKLFVFDRYGDDGSFGGPHAYVHSKLLIVDDLAATIGSMNMNRRSWYNDSELEVLLTDAPDVIRDLRIKVWTEHLKGIDSWDDLRSPMSGLGIWRDCYQGKRKLPRVKPISFASAPPRDPPSGYIKEASRFVGMSPAQITDLLYDLIYDPTGPASCP